MLGFFPQFCSLHIARWEGFSVLSQLTFYRLILVPFSLVPTFLTVTAIAYLSVILSWIFSTEQFNPSQFSPMQVLKTPAEQIQFLCRNIWFICIADPSRLPSDPHVHPLSPFLSAFWSSTNQNGPLSSAYSILGLLWPAAPDLSRGQIPPTNQIHPKTWSGLSQSQPRLQQL